MMMMTMMTMMMTIMMINDDDNDDDQQLHLKVIGPIECKQPVLTIELPGGNIKNTFLARSVERTAIMLGAQESETMIDWSVSFGDGYYKVFFIDPQPPVLPPKSLQ